MSEQRCARNRCMAGVHGRGLCQKHRRAAVDAGEFESWSLVDATATKAHVVSLNAAGISYQDLAKISGVGFRSLLRMPTLDRVRKRTADRILAVPVPAQAAPSKTAMRVDQTGTMRRLQALVAIGHTQEYLAARLGMIPTNLHRLTRGAQSTVTARRAREVQALYAQLENTPGQSDRARELATARHWAPPIAWDDDTIDDPKAKPQHNAHSFVRFAERFDELREIERVRVTKTSEVIEYFETVLNDKPENVQRQIDRYRANERKAIAS